MLIYFIIKFQLLLTMGYKVCFDEKEIHVDAGNISEFDISVQNLTMAE